MLTPRNRHIGSITCVLLVFLAAASAQINLTTQSEPPHAAAPSDNQSDVGTITENDFRYLKPSFKETLLRVWQYQFQLLEQPSYLVASVPFLTLRYNA